MKNKKQTDLPETTISDILNKNNTFLILLGYASSLLFTMHTKGMLNELDEEKFEWFKKAVENVIYKNIPPPEIP